jgi:hypothetical protein
MCTAEGGRLIARAKRAPEEILDEEHEQVLLLHTPWDAVGSLSGNELGAHVHIVHTVRTRVRAEEAANAGTKSPVDSRASRSAHIGVARDHSTRASRAPTTSPL